MKHATINEYIELKSSFRNNSILAPTGHLGISRTQMPQIDFKYRDSFIRFIKSQGISVRTIRVPAKSLKLIQGEYNRDKVGSIIDKGNIGDAPIYISLDSYVIDGNHRLIAQLNMPEPRSNYIGCIELGMNAKDLLDVIEQFPNVRYRGLNENKLK